MVLEVIRHRLAALETLADLRMGEIARDNDRSGERKSRLYRILRQNSENFLHRLVQVDANDARRQFLLVDVRHEARRIGLELLEPDTLAGDLAERLAIGRAGNAEPDRQRGAVARQADDPHVVAEILAAELGPDA